MNMKIKSINLEEAKPLVPSQLNTSKLFSKLKNIQSRDLAKQNCNFKTKLSDNQTPKRRPKSMYALRMTTESIRESDSRLFHRTQYSRTKRFTTVSPKNSQTSIRYHQINKNCLKKISQFQIGTFDAGIIKNIVFSPEQDQPNQAKGAPSLKYIKKGLKCLKRRKENLKELKNKNDSDVIMIGSKII